jgi:nicotinamidase-related amidase
MNIHLLIIDPQNDFVHPEGALSVPGAHADMDRLAAFIDRASDQITSIDVTLDSHHRLDISHPLWWRHGETGEMPAPFTQITAADVEAGTWKAYDPAHQARSLAYLHALAAEGGYPHTIWPEHCLIGHAGHNVWPTLAAAIHRWEDAGRHTTFVHKGDNPWTEHFSAVRAEVPYADDPSTDVDHDLLARIRASDITLVAGEARSHCVANTVRDILRHADDADTLAPKLHLLTDAMTDVPDPPGTTLFSDLGNAFFDDMRAAGLGFLTTETALHV